MTLQILLQYWLKFMVSPTVCPLSFNEQSAHSGHILYCFCLGLYCTLKYMQENSVKLLYANCSLHILEIKHHSWFYSSMNIFKDIATTILNLQGFMYSLKSALCDTCKIFNALKDEEELIRKSTLVQLHIVQFYHL